MEDNIVWVDCLGHFYLAKLVSGTPDKDDEVLVYYIDEKKEEWVNSSKVHNDIPKTRKRRTTSYFYEKEEPLANAKKTQSKRSPLKPAPGTNSKKSSSPEKSKKNMLKSSSPKQSKKKKLKNLPPQASSVVYEDDEVLEVVSVPDNFFLRYFFPHRITINANVTNTKEVKATILRSGKFHQLVATKFVNGRKFNRVYGKDYIKCYYVEEQPGTRIQDELASLANFATLSREKAASRMELLVSRLERHYILEDSMLLQEIEERSCDGCGFIGEKLLMDILGNGSSANRCFAIQVRVLCPTSGLYKGVLVKKRNIKGIELPPSMKKVTEPKDPKFSQVHIGVKGTWPSTSSWQHDRAMHPTKYSNGGATQSANKDRKGIAEMIETVLVLNGVSREGIKEYSNNAVDSWDNYNHEFLVGVSDMTNSLPENSIFITGIIGSRAFTNRRTCFVTRIPCTEKNDGLVLPIVTKRPKGCSKEDWNFLCSLNFGGIVFGKSRAGEQTLPKRIANGDLDGDLYFVLWDHQILSQISSEPNYNGSSVALFTDEEVNEEHPWNNDGVWGSSIGDGNSSKTNTDYGDLLSSNGDDNTSLSDYGGLGSSNGGDSNLNWSSDGGIEASRNGGDPNLKLAPKSNGCDANLKVPAKKSNWKNEEGWGCSNEGDTNLKLAPKSNWSKAAEGRSLNGCDASLKAAPKCSNGRDNDGGSSCNQDNATSKPDQTDTALDWSNDDDWGSPNASLIDTTFEAATMPHHVTPEKSLKITSKGRGRGMTLPAWMTRPTGPILIKCADDNDLEIPCNQNHAASKSNGTNDVISISSNSFNGTSLPFRKCAGDNDLGLPRNQNHATSKSNGMNDAISISSNSSNNTSLSFRTEDYGSSDSDDSDVVIVAPPKAASVPRRSSGRYGSGGTGKSGSGLGLENCSNQAKDGDDRKIAAKKRRSILNDDPLLRQHLFKQIEGKKRKGYVIRKLNNETYIADFRNYGEHEVSKSEITEGRTLTEIISHKTLVSKNNKISIEIKFRQDGKVHSATMNSQMKKDMDTLLTEYAIKNKLQDSPGWEFTRRNIIDLKIVRITNDRYAGKEREVQAEFEDGSKEWKPISYIRDDEDDRLKLACYAQKKGLLDEKDFLWANDVLEQQSENWFEHMQAFLSDISYVCDVSKLKSAMHSLWKNSISNNSYDACIYGRAYKASLDIEKHPEVRILYPSRLLQVFERKFKEFKRYAHEQEEEV